MKINIHHVVLGTAVFFASCSTSDKKEDTNGTDSTATAAAMENGEPEAAKDTLAISGHIEFPSKDGLMITADSYELLPGKGFILLCHQADFSRGEYTETAKRLNGMGYNCLAIDQRSGNTCNGVDNLTAQHAKEKGLKTDYTDAEQDIAAAIDYINHRSGKKVIVVGSSYSAALALKIAKSNDKVAAVAVFSPGEYLKGIELKKDIEGLNVPVFATSSKKEAVSVAKLLTGVTNKDIFVPTVEGDHGSKVLWPGAAGNEEYWNAFSAFLKKNTEQSI